MTGDTSEAGTAYPSGEPEFTPSHCVFCPSIYWFWLHLWYLQTFLVENQILLV